MVEDVFKFKDIDHKWEIVKEHYERSYKVTFKKRPDNAVVADLYKQIKLLKDSEFFHKQPKN